jgi:hypothetical protein
MNIRLVGLICGILVVSLIAGILYFAEVQNPEKVAADEKSVITQKPKVSYVINTTMPEVPKTIIVYQPVYNTMTNEKVEQLARALHLPGEVTETPGTYRILSDDFYFFVYKESGHTYFTNNKRGAAARTIDSPEHLPSDAEAIRIVQDFLQSINRTPSDIAGVRTMHEGGVDITETGNHKVAWDEIVVYFQRQIGGIPVKGSRF